MRRKISVHDLRLGMYVADLDRPWRSTRFLYQGFEIDSQTLLDMLKQLCQFVYIDTEGGGGKKCKFRRSLSAAAHQDVLYERGECPTHTVCILKEPLVNKRWHPDKTTLTEELEPARGIEKQAKDVLYSTLEDVRLGKNISTTAAKQVVAEMVESVIRNPDAMVVLSQLKDVDEYTALHSLRVCILALAFGRHLELSREELNLLGVGALLHDVGKMKVPGEILNKPNHLTEQEFDMMKSHVPEGVKILEKSAGILPLSIQVAARHHERYGGGGYAAGLSGDAIGSFGLIGGIVDCYDAITSDRVYHKGLSAYEALSRMYEWRTRDFHPGLVEQFIQCMGIYPIGSVVELSTGAIGVVVSVNRERRLKPSVALVLNPDKQPYSCEKIVDLMHESPDDSDNPLEITKVIPIGSYGINPVDHLVKIE